MADPVSDELTGAVAIVTGASGGVGRATVELLAARGARVVPALPRGAAGTQRPRRRSDRQRRLYLRHDRVAGANRALLTKGALVQLTRQLAIEHAPRVRVNAVAAGAIDTGFTDEAMAGVPDREARLASIAAAHPLGRLARAEEIAEVIAFWPRRARASSPERS
jgi:NAD(P)-dependent dehydrogenase (short-subunit alcohol dehydrogenase family)